ncbi:DNA-directed 5'-3' RNA polymerase [Aureococcus anophagefferens]|nr:DNA-directed 5'-3' RNA polymerase [Aureococcus anophagefferens]
MSKIADARAARRDEPDYGIRMPWGLFLGSVVVAAACVAYPELHHLYRTVKCVVPGDRITSFEAQRGDGGCWAAFNVSVGDSWGGRGAVADCLGACGGCGALSARTRWTVHCAEDAACAWYARTRRGRRRGRAARDGRRTSGPRRRRPVGQVPARGGGLHPRLRAPPGDAEAGPTPPGRVLDELPCEYPLNHRWKVKRGKKETLCAFIHNQTEQFLRPYVAAAGEALAPVTGPVPRPSRQARVFDDGENLPAA